MPRAKGEPPVVTVPAGMAVVVRVNVAVAVTRFVPMAVVVATLSFRTGASRGAHGPVRHVHADGDDDEEARRACRRVSAIRLT